MRPISLKTLSGALFITLCAATTAFAATTEADSLSAALSRARTPAEREQTYVRLADLCADSTALAALYWEAALTEAAGAGDDYGCREALDRLVQGFSAKQPERALEYVRLVEQALAKLEKYPLEERVHFEKLCREELADIYLYADDPRAAGQIGRCIDLHRAWVAADKRFERPAATRRNT